jgi:hypothetical protein
MGDVSPLGFLMVVISAFVVAIDAKNLNVRRGCLGGGFFDIGPTAWFFGTVFLWIVAVPGYLITRPRYVDLQRKSGQAAYWPPSPQHMGMNPAAHHRANFCPQCGEALEPGDRFCQNCGHSLQA